MRGRCDAFSDLVLAEWKRSQPETFMRQPALGDVTNLQVVKPVAAKPKPPSGTSKRSFIDVDALSSPPRKKARVDVLPTPPSSHRKVPSARA